MGTMEEGLPASIGILVVLAIAGIVGNALVLYVFSNVKQKQTSTIFILTLAGTDFITCLVTIPYTIIVEVVEHHIKYDALCKIYQLLITSTVPFSAFVMVAIAVDRYLCICHPFLHIMTIRRAKYIIGFLVLFSMTLGIMCCIQYGVYAYGDKYANPWVTTNTSSDFKVFSSTSSMLGESNSISDAVEPTVNSRQHENFTGKIGLVWNGKCSYNELVFDKAFLRIYQKLYSSLFGVCGVIVIILYAMIYRSVLARRRQRFKVVSSTCCGFWTSATNDIEETEITNLRNDTAQDDTEKEKLNINEQKNGTHVDTKDKDSKLKTIGGVSRAKLEKMRMANIKTAFMLSIVALVFIVSFLPAWLMALALIPMRIVVFYMYFLYNVANPIIYAFMNQNFRNQLKDLFKCHK